MITSISDEYQPIHGVVLTNPQTYSAVHQTVQPRTEPVLLLCFHTDDDRTDRKKDHQAIPATLSLGFHHRNYSFLLTCLYRKVFTNIEPFIFNNVSLYTALVSLNARHHHLFLSGLIQYQIVNGYCAYHFRRKHLFLCLFVKVFVDLKAVCVSPHFIGCS